MADTSVGAIGEYLHARVEQLVLEKSDLARKLEAMTFEHDAQKRLADLRGAEVAKWAHESGSAKGRADKLASALSEACDAIDELDHRGNYVDELDTFRRLLGER